MKAKVHLTAEDDGLTAPFPSALAVWGAKPAMLTSLDAALPGAWRAG